MALTYVAADAAETVPFVDAETLEQRVVHAVKLYVAVSEQQGYEYPVLHHGAEVARAETVAVAPELHAAEAAEERRMEGYDAHIGVGHGGAVVEMLGVIVLHVEIHGPSRAAVESLVEGLDTFAATAAAEELRVRQHVIFRSQRLELLPEGEEVHGHDVAGLLFGLAPYDGHLVAQGGAVAEDGDAARGVHADGAGAGDMVAEILLHGHRGEEECGVETVAQGLDYP